MGRMSSGVSSLSKEECPSCGSLRDEFHDLPFAFFRHLDFDVIKHGGRLSVCGQCGLIENRLDDEEARRIDEMFLDADYLQCEFMEHTLSVAVSDTPVTRTSLQARLIRERMDIANPRILEIGCFHGDLLRDLDAQYDAAELHGHDISEGFRKWFPEGKQFHFWCGELKEIKGRFDMIILSGSIMYIRDIEGLMSGLRHLLKPDGEVFVQAVDISRNPYAILLGDQFYHYTPAIMSNLFANSGFEFEVVACGWFPKELIGFARVRDAQGAPKMRKDEAVLRCIDTIHRKADEITRMAEDVSAFGVLGTTSAAAFVDSVVSPRVRFFADENPKRVGLAFHGKPVVHPASLKDDDVLVIPYGGASKEISSRFAGKYKGRFICL